MRETVVKIIMLDNADFKVARIRSNIGNGQT